MNIEKLIIQNLITNDEYARKVVPFLKPEYFHDRKEKHVFKTIQAFIVKYQTLPSKEAVVLSLEQESGLSDTEFKTSGEFVMALPDSKESNTTWLLEETEKFCKDKAVYNAIMESIHIIDGKNTLQTQNVIPELLSEALSVCFDTNIGHDYIEDYEDRYDFYHRVEERMPFDLEMFNTITNGGIPKKTISVIMAGTGCGKSLFMCHHAANCLSQNKNVLYITLEMAEERIAERIDSNLMDMTINDVRALPKAVYQKKLERIKNNTKGKLIVKEYPTASANVTHFRALLKELQMKKKFKPDIIFVDYINICSSSRLKNNASNVNSYSYVKAIAEELRGLAVEFDLPLITATQTNRTGFTSSDVGLEDVSESFGLPATADFMFALMTDENLEQQNKIMVKQLKNRFNEIVTNKKFLLKINRGKMKLYDDDGNDVGNGLVDTNASGKTVHGSGYGPDPDEFSRPKKSFGKNVGEWKI
jgi:replicative DNA helicase